MKPFEQLALRRKNSSAPNPAEHAVTYPYTLDRMTSHTLLLPLTIAVLSLGACDASYRDVSSMSPHDKFIGKVCTVEQDIRAHGVALKLEKNKRTDFVSIWNPGFNGPEMTFLVVLKPATRLKVVVARECTNCPFDRSLKYQVLVEPEPHEFQGKPAYVRSESLAMPDVKCPTDAA